MKWVSNLGCIVGDSLTTPEDLGPTCHRDRVSRGGSSPIATDRDRIRAHRALKRNFNPVSPAGGPRLAEPASQLLVQGRGSGSRRPAYGPVVPVRAPPPPQQRARTKLTFSFRGAHLTHPLTRGPVLTLPEASLGPTSRIVWHERKQSSRVVIT